MSHRAVEEIDFINNEIGKVQGTVVDVGFSNITNYLVDHVENASRLTSWIERHCNRYALLKTIAIYTESGGGNGTRLLSRFMTDIKGAGAEICVLIADNSIEQDPGFNLTEWYQKNGFHPVVGTISTIDNMTQNVFMVWPAHIGKKMQSDLD